MTSRESTALTKGESQWRQHVVGYNNATHGDGGMGKQPHQRNKLASPHVLNDPDLAGLGIGEGRCGAGKRIVLEDGQGMASRVSKTSPVWFHHPDKRAGLQASGEVPGLERLTKRWKKPQVVCEETGIVRNAAIVSVNSPDFMKAPFESNRDFFEQQGVAQRAHTLKSRHPERAAGKPIHEDAEAAVRGGIRPKGLETAVTAVTKDAPDHFYTAYARNEEALSSKHLYGRPVKEPFGKEGATAGAFDKERKVHSKQIVLKCPDSGKNRSVHHRNYEQAPDFMNAPYWSNVDKYHSRGFGADGSPRDFAHAGRDAGLQERGKNVAYVDDYTGKVYNKNIQSPEAPTWAKSAFESNRAYFEANQDKLKIGRVQELCENHDTIVGKRAAMTASFHDGHSKRHVFPNTRTGELEHGFGHYVSRDAPKFMTRSVSARAAARSARTTREGVRCVARQRSRRSPCRRPRTAR
eukprot:TRINITY_DN64007_c0_g1_i1.p1 TRINITY_DN64007_c0_g1~~TRINITY_DN64007_c0_g1_i1.p1  ORF type:complete len:465 (-),score=63.67 TRINITY_DN64007_c0_g1_i1:56-1450(-)